jgi:hypothetical protein
MTTETDIALALLVAEAIEIDADDRFAANFGRDGDMERLHICRITFSEARAIARILREYADGGWRPIATAPKDGSIIWAKLSDDIYPGLQPGREDLARWNGVHVQLRHPGLADDGFDIGWGIAAPVGHGGFPDEWIAGWRPLPSPPSEQSDD